MALNLKNKPFVTDIPEDTYTAICVGIYDIGTVHSPQYDKDSEKVIFEFEIPELVNAEGWPKTVNVEYTASLDDRSNLKKVLMSWRGKGFTAEEKKNFSVKQFLGKPASLLIVHSNGKGEKADNVYHNVAQISAIPRGVPVPSPSRQPVCFDFADGKAEIPEGVSEYVQKKITAAPEWKALKEGVPASGPRKGPARPPQSAPAEIVDTINEIGLAWPFTMDQLETMYPADFGQETYDILKKHATDFSPF